MIHQVGVEAGGGWAREGCQEEAGGERGWVEGGGEGSGAVCQRLASLLERE